MTEANDQLRHARERVESPHAPGQPASRQDLAEMANEWIWQHRGRRTDLDANYVGKLERGLIRSPQADYRAALRAITGVRTDPELGFRVRRHSSPAVGNVDRKEFIRAVIGVGAAAVSSAPLLELLTPDQATPVPNIVTQADIDGVRTAAQVFGSWDNHYGGGLAREAVIAQLRHSAEMLDSRCPENLRGELFSSVGFLGHVCAMMAFDAYAHDDARRMFRFTQACADEAGDWNLRAKTLSSIARQAIWCGDPDEGLTLTEMALVRADRLTATERAMLLAARARALAKLGRVQETLRTVGLADEQFSQADPANDPAWMRYYDRAQHLGDTGHALWDLAVRQGQAEQEAASRLASAVAGHTETYVRSRAMSGIKLASLTMTVGDPQEAAVIGAQALKDARSLRSRRAADDLRDLAHRATVFERVDEVAELRHDIRNVLAAS
ncbi:helix-turn-helix transcriptional regulator [Kribbella hippodromi]|uniref:Helix-turn-helix transcriptional regulator n=1 Tax=Kribbella hippodromi TaxID=434347 RepID=A0ABN2E4T5_9ACTN